MPVQIDTVSNGVWGSKHDEDNHKLNLDGIWAWNSTAPEPVEACVHGLVKRSVCEQPLAPAICSRDGDLTYRELDTLSSNLAYRLVDLGVSPGHNVILCFEKNMIVPVVMLGVMKAGGVSVALDTTLEESQLHAMVARVPATLVLSSSASNELAQRLTDSHAAAVVVVDFKLLSRSTSFLRLRHNLPIVSPFDNVCVVFTSASAAGTPKAVVITHRNFSSAVVYQQRALGFKPTSRVFDFAPYTSHVAWCNFLHTLTCGGCLCIPSEADCQDNIEGSMSALRVNYVQLTPSISRALDFSKIPGLTQINYVGDQVNKPASDHPSKEITQLNIFGSAETTSLTTMGNLNGLGSYEIRFSSEIGICGWVVDADEPDLLAPVGVVGELWLEGPLVGQYLNESDKLATGFVQDPAWLLRGTTTQPGRHGRVYRTGNLVRYTTDGVLIFVGCKDSGKSSRQYNNSNGSTIASDSSPSSDALLLNRSSPSDKSLLTNGSLPTDESSPASNGSLITTVSSPTDEPLLIELSFAKLDQLDSERVAPQSATEKCMQLLWAEVLHLNPDIISTNNNFFKMGGDALKALRLTRAASKRGLSFTVRDVFQYPLLRDISTLADLPNSASESYIPPFSLLSSDIDKSEARIHAAHLCHVQESQVIDIFPCTPLQEGLLALTARRSGDYVARNVFEIPDEIEASKLHSAWDQVIAMNPILRTRVVSLLGHGIMQIVLEESGQWTSGTTLDDHMEQQDQQIMGLGTPLSRFTIFGEGIGKPRYLLWEIHHALYDGWSIPLLLQDAEHAYYNETGQALEPMTGFIKYIINRDEVASKAFWKAQFTDIIGSHFPPSKGPVAVSPQPDCQIHRRLSGLDWAKTTFTPATIARAAWSVVTASSTGSNEAIFGATVTGRQAPLHGIELMEGPAIATLPIRVTLDWEASVDQLLSTLQRQAAEMISYEQTGLQRIRRVSEEAAIACNFQTLLVVQPAEGNENTPARPFLSEHKGDEGSTEWQDFSTYAIVIECQLDRDEVCLRVAFDSKIISQSRIERITQQFEGMIRLLYDGGKGKEPLRKVVPLLNQWDPIDIWTWNAVVPEPTEECVHNLIIQRARERPSAPAVCAWDGDLTYRQLDELSSTLAYRLVAKNVGPGAIIPLFFEKSMWMPVAALAVMKAGAASIALDTTQPVDRLRTITSQAGRSLLVLSSVAGSDLAKQLDSEEVVVVGPEQLLNSSPSSSQDPSASPALTEHVNLPSVSPSNTLYVVFTSGSTGKPKGAIITHRNFSSVITYQQKALGYSSTSRVFDFASYAFDVAWGNLLHALTSGGCLCIPSNTERENSLAECLKKYRVTTSDFTPSVARFLGPHTLSKLSTLLLGGETVLPADAHLAGNDTQIINVYGPAECSLTCTFKVVNAENSIGIGRGAGVCTWVVEPNNPDALSSIGSVGELWIEGPLVGEGYLGEPEKTAAAFVRDPTWLLQGAPGHPGRHGLLYRTGDLVKYDEDGTLIFVGRKDTQVKIRGQRIELGEVEHYVQRAIKAENVQVIAETIQPNGTTNATLIAFVTLELAEEMTDESHSAAVRQVTSKLLDTLTEELPVFMIPAAFIPLQKIPISATGKTDRQLLRTLGMSMWLQYRSTAEKDAPVETLSEVERILQKVWMSVLNLSVEEASVTKAFMRLGGDSISAMQVVSQCRLHNIAFTVSDVLHASTIRNLAARCRVISRYTLSEEEEQQEEDTTEPFDLSPIQQMFFDAYPDGLNHYNQSFMLELTKAVPTSTLKAALEAVVSRHSMLRASFHRDPVSRVWRQSVADNWTKSFDFAEHFVTDESVVEAEVTKAAQWRQEHLDISEGPIFACDIFTIPGTINSILLLSAHHLVIDLVSFRIVWNDIEEYVEHNELRSQKPASFRLWGKHQIRNAQNSSPLSVLPFPVPKPELDFWGLQPHENTFGNCESYNEYFDRDVTALLFGDSNESLKTEPMDILLGSLVYSFFHTFPERPVPVIWLEGHGRDQSDELSMDVSGTVGWFTTLYPVPVPITSDSSIIDAIRLAKDMRRSVPGKGRPYFACRYHSDSGREAFQGQDVVEFLFNFTGRYQQLEGEEGLFRRSGYDVSEVSGSARRGNMVEITADIEEDELDVIFSIHKKMNHQDRLRQWFEDFTRTVDHATHQLQRHPVGFTLSDLPLLQLSYPELDTILKEQLPSMGIEPSTVIDIYPCSPLQEGVLLSSQKGSASYATYSVWECAASPDATSTEISPSQLEAAWRTVVSRHTILSTVFGLHPEGNGFLQILLSGSKVRVTHMTVESGSSAAALHQLERPEFEPHEPGHTFIICQSGNGDIACRLDISHALIDALSMSVLVQEIISVYDRCDLPATPAFGEMIRYINSVPRAQKTAAWAALLDGVEPCEFPTANIPSSSATEASHNNITLPVHLMSGVAGFCRKLEITRSVFLQVAWAMALSHFTGMYDVCFGYLASGRDAPLNGVESMVGPLANLLIGRVDLRELPRQVLETTAKKSIDHLTMQHASLAEIQHQLGISGKSLFNTSLSIRESDKLKSEEARSIIFSDSNGEDPHEYDLSLSANIDGDNMDIVMEFREPYVTQQVAEEAYQVLVKAIEYLLATNVDRMLEEEQENRFSMDNTAATESLFTGFFKHLVGADNISTTRFWQGQFANIQGSNFPPVKVASYHPQPDSQVRLHLPGLDWESSGFTASTIIRSAWAIVTVQRLGSNEALFGATATSSGTEEIAGSVSEALVPVCVPLDWGHSANQLLEQVHCQAIEMVRFQQVGLQWIRRLSDEAALGCNFQSLLVVQPAKNAEDGSVPKNIEDEFAKMSYAIVAEFELETNEAHICVNFDSNVMEESQVMRLALHVEHVLRQLLDVTQREKKLQEIAKISHHDLNNIWAWNSVVPEPADTCVHDLIIMKCHEQPLAPAITAWDGDLSYQQLDELSTGLAYQLVDKGIKGSIVPLYFEKSMWTSVAALAVMKAGGASVLIDTTTPEERLRAIFAQVKPLLVLSSAPNVNLLHQLEATEVVVVDHHQCQDYVVEKNIELPSVSSSDTLFVIFTSGTTGTPKGVIITHGNFCSAIVHQRDTLGFTGTSRVFDFASYMFDIAWSNMLNTLTAGGCLCVPSAEERQNNLSGCLQKYKVTMTDLTPSVARFIEPKSVLSNLSTLLLGGEEVLQSDILLAGEKTLVVSAYGPAECTPTSTIVDLNKRGSGIGGGAEIGRGFGLCTWVVEADNPEVLAPIGAIGELWLEGPLVGKGYLNDPDKTAAAFIDDPAWLLQGAPGNPNSGRHGRVYRTGDLVEYKENGALIFIGRKDTQVKIRGQRVELGEIEHCVKRAIEASGRAIQVASGANVQVAAETIQPKGTETTLLVTFVALDGAEASMMAEEEYESAVRQVTAGITDQLEEKLPRYMVPGAYIPISKIPISPTGKIDRKRLRTIGSTLTTKYIASLSGLGKGGQGIAPQTDSERLVQSLWAEVLHLSPENINIEDNFFRIGGDSVGAIRLVGVARQKGLSLTVRDVFRHPILRDLAALNVSDSSALPNGLTNGFHGDE
ncbi:Non-ribosomal peptide synthetase [Myotisia sp. PD_48]|nr:Non-ribosomal peptide synthetase [Myotisia sp. PD_48]